MRDDITKGKVRQIRGKKRPHWAILTLDDLDKTNWKHNWLIIQLRAKYQAAKEQGKNRHYQKADDFSMISSAGSSKDP